MKLSTVLVLCCSFFSSRAKPLSTQDADCDDPDVFEAVDIALRKYNGDKTDGNQFALYMVMEAKRLVSKLCKICFIKQKAEFFGWFVFFSVEGKVTLSHVPCLGCYHPIPGDSLQLLPILSYVVAGWNYAIEYEVKETSCTKNNFQDLSPECKPIVGGHIGTCEAKAYVDLNNTIVDVAQKCKFPVDETAPPRISICAGCPKPIPTDSTELEEPLRASLEKYNEESNDDFYYKAEAISYATVQVGIPLSFSCSILFRITSQYFLEMGHGYGESGLRFRFGFEILGAICPSVFTTLITRVSECPFLQISALLGCIQKDSPPHQKSINIFFVLSGPKTIGQGRIPIKESDVCYTPLLYQTFWHHFLRHQN
uniref:Cystatin domain-containing protein n=1 Tax=Gopherus evgoodei TaxID=1825980 RepID=A0A8C4XZC6_9SAUR